MNKLVLETMNNNLKTALITYLALIEKYFTDQNISIYIIGSIALGDYRQGKSDVDFVTVREKAWDSVDLDCLAQLHNELRKIIKNPKFDGIYLTFNELQYDPALCSPPFVLDNQFHRSGGFAANPITWKQLKTYALLLVGRDDLDVEIDEDYVIKWCVENVKTYWKNWVESVKYRFPKNILGLLKSGAEWGVLGISRIYVTVSSKRIVSKTEAVEIVKLVTEPQWHPLLDSAFGIRTNTKRKRLNAFKRRKLVIEFMDYMISRIERMSN